MPYTPDQTEILDTAIRSFLHDLHTILPGRVEKYDHATQTADVLPMVRRPVRDEDGDLDHEDLPVISNVPVQWPRGGGYSLHFPLAKGDFVVLLFSEVAIAQWRETGELSNPGDLRRHDLSYPIAVPGIAPVASPLEDAPEDEATITVAGGGHVRVSTANGSANFVALANLVNAIFTLIKNAVPAAPIPGPGATGDALAAALLTAIASPSWASVAATTLKAE